MVYERFPSRCGACVRGAGWAGLRGRLSNRLRRRRARGGYGFGPVGRHGGASSPGPGNPRTIRSIAIYEHIPPSPYPASSPVISPPTVADLPNGQGPCLRNSSGHPVSGSHKCLFRPVHRLSSQNRHSAQYRSWRHRRAGPGGTGRLPISDPGPPRRATAHQPAGNRPVTVPVRILLHPAGEGVAGGDAGRAGPVGDDDLLVRREHQRRGISGHP
jgi:hypothetical protein